MKIRFRGHTPKMSLDQYREALRCHRIHAETPTLSALARQWGIPRGTVIDSVNRGIKGYEMRIRNESLGQQESANAREAD